MSRERGAALFAMETLKCQRGGEREDRSDGVRKYAPEKAKHRRGGAVCRARLVKGA